MTILLIKVYPNAKKNSFDGFHAGRLRVKIKAPPDKGKANEALIEFFAETLHLPKNRIRIVSGHASQLKRLEIKGDINFSEVNLGV